jgi:chloramphenicol O-acetyltransferase type A
MNTGTGSDLFKMVTLEMTENLHEFVRLAKETSEKQKEFICLEALAGRDDFLYLTCLPWISFTHMSHTISLNRDDAVPRISWGKYFREGDKLMLPFSVQVHHALVDGIHVAQYLERLQNHLNEPETMK